MLVWCRFVWAYGTSMMEFNSATEWIQWEILIVTCNLGLWHGSCRRRNRLSCACLHHLGYVPIQGLHPWRAAFVDRLHHIRRNKAVPIWRVRQMRPMNAAFISWVWKLHWCRVSVSGSASFICFICWPMRSHLAQHPFHLFLNSEGRTRWIFMDPAYPKMHCGPAFSPEERARTVNDAAGHLLI